MILPMGQRQNDKRREAAVGAGSGTFPSLAMQSLKYACRTPVMRTDHRSPVRNGNAGVANISWPDSALGPARERRLQYLPR